MNAVVFGTFKQLKVYGRVCCADKLGGRGSFWGTECEDVADVAEGRPTIDIRYSELKSVSESSGNILSHKRGHSCTGEHRLESTLVPIVHEQF